MLALSDLKLWEVFSYPVHKYPEEPIAAGTGDVEIDVEICVQRNSWVTGVLNTYQGAPGLLCARDREGLLVEESLCNYPVSWKYQNIYVFFFVLFFIGAHC